MILFFSEKLYRNYSRIKSKSVFHALTKMQMVLKDDILTKDMVMDKYKASYEVTSFATESFDDSVNGSLRKGDIVDVYAKDPTTEMLTLMA